MTKMYRTLCPVNNSIYSYIVKRFNFTFHLYTSLQNVQPSILQYSLIKTYLNGVKTQCLDKFAMAYPDNHSTPDFFSPAKKYSAKNWNFKMK